MKWMRKHIRDTRGAVAVMTALLTPVLVGGLSIVVDASYWRYRTSILQNAADMVALSLAVDLSVSTAGVTTPTLTVNARNEARKFGCVINCNIVVTYPYASSSQAVMVTMTDPMATRFFSILYESAARTLSGRAAARVGTASGPPAGENAGAGCVLALQNSGAYGIRVDASAVASMSGCELISNSNDPQAIFAQGNITINNRSSAVGGIAGINGASFTSMNASMTPAAADPYSPTLQSTSHAINMSQFRQIYAAGNGFLQGECMEFVNEGGGGNPTLIDWSQNLSTTTGSGGNPWVPSLGSRSYSTFLDGSGRRVHNFNGGGGRFCADFNVSNAVINFGPGVYFFNRDVNISGASVQGIGTGTVTIPNEFVVGRKMIPRAAGLQTNGTTFVRGPQNFSIVNSQLSLAAPTIGPYAGLAFVMDTTFGPSNGGTVVEFGGSQFQWSGLLYMPRSIVRAQGGGTIKSLLGTDGTVASGCSQMVAWSLFVGADTRFANTCANRGLRPFGTGSTGWNVGSGSGSGIAARLIN